jgi:hypothetical protein
MIDLARRVASEAGIAHVSEFVQVIEFLDVHPEFVTKIGAQTSLTEDWLEKAVWKFERDRASRAPSITQNVPDPLISVICEKYFSIKASEQESLKEHHLMAMAAENVVGAYLEKFIASIAEPNGWIWCSGSLVRSIDFIKKKPKSQEWTLLQVKNRSNSENSSSAAVRANTSIEKWFRLNASSGSTCWDTFPDRPSSSAYNESNFHVFVERELKSL